MCFPTKSASRLAPHQPFALVQMQWLPEDEQAFVKDFAGNLPTAEAEMYYAVQPPIGKAITMTKTTVAAWHDKPTWYAVSTDDRTIDPDLQRFVANRMHAHTIELKSSHVSLLSHPTEVAVLILEATGEQK